MCKYKRNNGDWERSDEYKATLFVSHLSEVLTPFEQTNGVYVY